MKIKFLFATAPVLLFIFGCNEHAPLRENANAQNAVLTQSKLAELAPSEGIFVGRMRMRRSNNIYDCVLTIKTLIDHVHSPSADRPAETDEVPKLTATLTFPILSNLNPQDYQQYKDITDPMGVERQVMVDYGNFNTTTGLVTLPYGVIGYPEFGNLTGRLVSKRLTGTWYAKPLGTVGDFDLIKQ